MSCDLGCDIECGHTGMRMVCVVISQFRWFPGYWVDRLSSLGTFQYLVTVRNCAQLLYNLAVFERVPWMSVVLSRVINMQASRKRVEPFSSVSKAEALPSATLQIDLRKTLRPILGMREEVCPKDSRGRQTCERSYSIQTAEHHAWHVLKCFDASMPMRVGTARAIYGRRGGGYRENWSISAGVE